MPSFGAIVRNIWHGRTLVRTLFNFTLRTKTIRGVVFDVGGGRNQDYLSYVKKENVSKVLTADIAHGDADVARVDFEKDPLPAKDSSVDSVIAFNILEHIYHHDFLVREMYRITKQGGTLLGVVPFLVNYHPDPHDYFRYTKEALRTILAEAGYTDIRVMEIGGGPLFANYNNIVLSVPRPLRVIMFPCYYALDCLFLAVRPKARERYPLAYLFEAIK